MHNNYWRCPNMHKITNKTVSKTLKNYKNRNKIKWISCGIFMRTRTWHKVHELEHSLLCDFHNLIYALYCKSIMQAQSIQYLGRWWINSLPPQGIQPDKWERKTVGGIPQRTKGFRCSFLVLNMSSSSWKISAPRDAIATTYATMDEKFPWVSSTVVEFATSAVPQQRESITTGREEDHLRTNLCLQRKDCLCSRNPNQCRESTSYFEYPFHTTHFTDDSKCTFSHTANNKTYKTYYKTYIILYS